MSKKFTPAEAAIAVLKKAEEMYKATNLAKGEWGKIHGKLKREGYSEKSADKIDGAIKAKMDKSEDGSDMGEMQMSEAAPKEGHHEKGSYKLAKFMGKMEMKKGSKVGEMDKAETGYEKGVHTQPGSISSIGNEKEARKGGVSEAGQALRGQGKSFSSSPSFPKQVHKEVLGEMKAQPKPKLPG